MSKAGEVPYTWEEMEAQIKDAIICQASILETYGPWADGRLLSEFLGVPLEELEYKGANDFKEIDLTCHSLYHQVRYAYLYAYQLDGWWDCSVEVWHEVDGMLQGYPQTDMHGEPSPFSLLNDFPLRRMLETFFARYTLFGVDSIGGDMTIRELSLLSNMTVPAVRTSLSKEGFKLERVPTTQKDRPDDRAFRLKEADAREWLSRRRGFIPQREWPEEENDQQRLADLLSDESIQFNTRIDLAAKLLELDFSMLAERAGVDRRWLSTLIQGGIIQPDLSALQRIARTFGQPEPDFAASGVRYILSLETDAERDLSHLG